MLYTAAVRAGSEVTFNANVSLVVPPSSSVTPDSSSSASSSYRKPSVHLSDGNILEADMIIGADGQHSTVRLSVQERPVKPKMSGTLAFTGNVPIRKVLEDDILKTENVAYSYVYWLGPRRCLFSEPSAERISTVIHHIIGYPIVSCRKSKHNRRTRLTLITVSQYGTLSAPVLGP